MKLLKKLICGIALLGLVVGCDMSDFGDMNVDPNNPSDPRTDLLITNSLRTVSNVVSATTPSLYVQYFSETQYTESSRYQTIQFDYTGWYNGVLMDLQTIIELNEDEATRDQVLSGGSNVNQIAFAKIMKAYFLDVLTTRWGYLPYNEALQGRELLRPSYDSQETIMKGLIAELDDAINMIDEDGYLFGDFLFNGDLNSWKRFANTLRMNIALRMSEADAATASSVIAETASNGVGYITSNVMYPYLDETANQSPWYDRYITRTDYAISETMTDYMKPLGDTRLLSFADAAPNKIGQVVWNGSPLPNTLDDVVGMPYGLTQADAGAITNPEISFPNSEYVRGQESALPIFTMSQLHFDLAEATARGWISGNAQMHYEDGIAASFAQFGRVMPASYLSQDEVAWDAAQWRMKIGYQKWIALFPNGYEAWAEWRRLDYPVLTPAPAALNPSKTIPVRHAYPLSESQLNEDNYNAAVQAQGEDQLNTKLWFDAN